MASDAEIQKILDQAIQATQNAFQTIPDNTDPAEYGRELARKAAEDIFSGAPDNPVRAFQLYNDALSGTGHSISAHDLSDNAKTPIGQAKERQRKDKAIEAFLNSFEATAKLQESLNNYFKGVDKTIEAATLASAKLTKTVDDFEQTLNDAIERGDLSESDAEPLYNKIAVAREKKEELTVEAAKLDDLNNELKSSAEIFADSLSIKGKTALADLMDMTGRNTATHVMKLDGSTTLLHLVHTDHNNNFYIINPDNNEKKYIENEEDIATLRKQQELGYRFGNSFTPDQHQQLISNIAIINSDTRASQEQKDQFLELLHKSRQQDIKVAYKTNELLKLEKEIEHLKKLVEENKYDAKALEPYTDQLVLKEYELHAKKVELREEFIKAGELKNEFDIKLADLTITQLENRIHEIHEKQNELEITREEIEQNFSKFPNRHEMLQDKYGSTNLFVKAGQWAFGDMDEENADFLKRLTLGEDLSLWEKMKAQGINGELIEAFKNTIRLDGKDVYLDNESLDFYTYDPQTGERNAIEDPVDLLEITRKYAAGQLVRNESPLAEDPENGFLETAANERLKSDNFQHHTHTVAEDIVNYFNRHLTQADKELSRKNEQAHELKAFVANAKINPLDTDFHLGRSPVPSLENMFNSATLSTSPQQSPIPVPAQSPATGLAQEFSSQNQPETTQQQSADPAPPPLPQDNAPKTSLFTFSKS